MPAGGNGHPGRAGPRAVATQRPAEWEAGKGPRTPRSPQNQACPLAQHSLFHMDLPVGLAGDVEVGQGALVVLGVRAAQHQLTPRLRAGVPGRRGAESATPAQAWGGGGGEEGLPTPTPCIQPDRWPHSHKLGPSQKGWVELQRWKDPEEA